MPTPPTVDEIEARVSETLEDCGVDRADVRRDAMLGQFDVDSVDLAELAMLIKDEYDVEVPQHELSHDRTVGDLLDYIVARVNGR